MKELPYAYRREKHSAVRPGQGLRTSTRFYKELGFTCLKDDDEVRCFKIGSFGFLLQDFYVKDWADNFMMAMHVADADEWWRHIQEIKLVENYPGVRANAPTLEDWGMIVLHLVDPTGVLWHITQDPVM